MRAGWGPRRRVPAHRRPKGPQDRLNRAALAPKVAVPPVACARTGCGVLRLLHGPGEGGGYEPTGCTGFIPATDDEEGQRP